MQLNHVEPRELDRTLDGKWKVLLLLAFAELLAMGTYLSTSAVTPALGEAWNLNDSGRAWLTMSVQAGFVIGSIFSAVLNLADRIPARLLFTISSFLAALSTAAIALWINSLGLTLILRTFTGIFLTGVYPVGMKIMATWTKADRGLAIGLLVGALSLGTASPHLLNALGGAQDWRLVLLLAAVFAAVGGIIGAIFVREGPFRSPTPPFNWRYTGEIFRKPELRLANLGYFGHMWELFGMWAWIAAFLLASFQVSGVNPAWASFAAFSAVGAGGLGSLFAGRLADRFGRTTITISSLAISGLCSLFIGLLFGANPILLTAVALVWGFAIVADSAQYSAAVSELCRKEYTGTALTVQTSLGFLLTLITIRLIPAVESLVGWQRAFAFLAVGPVIGIWAMASLRRLPESSKLAGGKK